MLIVGLYVLSRRFNVADYEISDFYRIVYCTDFLSFKIFMKISFSTILAIVSNAIS